jgi:hypothetical protein
MIVSLKCLPLTLAFLLLFSCSGPINPDAGDADHIFMAAGSVWDAGYEIELSKDGQNSSIFHDDVGFGCENQATDATNIYVTWFYKNGIERHASFYAGCENPISAKIEKFVYDLQEKALQSTLDNSWRSSESRFGIDKQ